MGQPIVIGTTDRTTRHHAHLLAVTVTAHCPGATGNEKVLAAWGAVQRVLGGAQSCQRHRASRPAPASAPLDYVHLSVAGFSTCCWCSLRADDDDFDACSTAAITDNLREHQAAGPHFPLMPATICRLTPPRTMRGSSQGKDCGS